MRSEMEINIQIRRCERQLTKAREEGDVKEVEYCEEQLRTLEIELEAVKRERRDREKEMELTM